MRYPKKIINNKNEIQAISDISATTIVKKEIKNRSEKIQQNNSTHSSFLNNKLVSVHLFLLVPD